MDCQTPNTNSEDSINENSDKKALLKLVKEAPTSPGVYLFKDLDSEDPKDGKKGKNAKILYIGKAKNLKNRLTSYFQPKRHESPRTEMLVNRIRQFEVILTETETEALILECTLIKKHKPKFNVRLKDDKAYPYIRVNMEDEHPRLEWTRRVKKDGTRYFGPFTSAGAARQVMQLLTEALLLRDCSDNTFRHRSRPCILYQMKKCSAPCVQKISSEDYKAQVQEAVRVLEGKDSKILTQLHEKMNAASKQEEFEQAAYYRDQIQHFQVVTQTQGMINATQQQNHDVIGLARKSADDSSEAQGCVLHIRGGKLLSVKHFQLQNTDEEVADEKLLSDFLAQYYLDLEKNLKIDDSTHKGVYVSWPEKVLVPFTPEGHELIEKTLHLPIILPESKEEEQLIQVAKTNARHALDQKKKPHSHGAKALEEIQKKLHLERIPQRIECYDISNTSGDEPVASRVVFIDGAPDKNLYRRYKIKTIKGANDFAMMKEVLSRRFLNKTEEHPDLVVVDGGKGQLSQAVEIFEELNIQGVAAVGLAKARTESDFKSKEIKSSNERIFIPNRKNPVPLMPHTLAYKLLTHIRDEAHRFAINYHRKLRSKKSLGR